MTRLIFAIVIAVALIGSGCGNGEQQTSEVSVPPSPPVEQPKASPETPEAEQQRATTERVPYKPKAANLHRAHYVSPPQTQVPAAAEDRRSVRLADDIERLPLQERLAWSKQEFEKRGINVRDDR